MFLVLLKHSSMTNHYCAHQQHACDPRLELSLSSVMRCNSSKISASTCSSNDKTFLCVGAKSLCSRPGLSATPTAVITSCLIGTSNPCSQLTSHPNVQPLPYMYTTSGTETRLLYVDASQSALAIAVRMYVPWRAAKPRLFNNNHPSPAL